MGGRRGRRVGRCVPRPGAGRAQADLRPPVAAHWAPFSIGLGALALDLVVALVATSLVRRRLPYTLWRRSHWAAYAAWPLALAHGLGAGTDRGTDWLRIVDAPT